MRRDARVRAKNPREMALRAEAQVERQLGQWCLCAFQKSESQPDTSPIHEPIEAQAGGPVKFAGKVAWR